eukprot:TRINITY_DN21787_c0_g1_i1.p1 TRINITY_DN21787_c0_g1~~TRINITY_DN21787_c0_g1_i1.p1  ORF type:complete len:291 (+),score=53.45 TRINITY_DN21787_c0_g1_i1:143-1015(+)
MQEQTTCLGILLQVLSIIASLGVAGSGAIQLNDMGVFSIDWCRSDAEACWTRNSNAELALTFYSITVIALGIFGLLSALNISFLDTPLGYLLPTGVIALGTARNTGIVSGSFAALVGLLQLLIFVVSSDYPAGFSISNASLPAWVVVFSRFLTACTMLAVMGTGAVVMYAISKDDNIDIDVKGLEWCSDVRNGNCWLETDTNTFALGSYGVALMLLGITGLLGALNIWSKVGRLRNTTALGAYALACGVVCFGAAGNTGIVVGLSSLTMGLWLLAQATFFNHEAKEYSSL